MAVIPPMPDLLDALGAIVIAAVGVAVWTVRPRTPVSRLLALFALSYGLWSLSFNIYAPTDPGRATAQLLGIPLGVATSVVIALLAMRIPRPLARSERRLLVLPLLLSPLGAFSFGYFQPSSSGWWDDASGAIGILFALTLLSLRYGRTADARERAQVAAVSTLLALQPGLAAAYQLLSGSLVRSALSLGPLLLVAAIWLAHMTARPAGAPLARRVALGILAIPATGALIGAFWGTIEGAFGVARVLMVLLIAHAVLRHRLLGFDVKVKRALGQSLVAGAFIGVFFVVSEAAARFFSEQVGPWLGIVATGALVFALAPLQQAAGRVADRAMPGVKGVAQMSPVERRAAYRDLLEAAWNDGVVDRSERAMLHRLRAALGLSTEEAEALENEFLERDAAPA